MTQPRALNDGPPSRRWAIGLLLVTAGVVLALDILTKQLALQHLSDRGPIRLLGGAVYLTLTRNSGAAFSFGRDHTWIFSVVTLAVLVALAWLARELRSRPWAWALGMVLGGALGNLTDRIFRAPGLFVGHVIDMVSLFDDRGAVWPVFNLADSCLMIGVAVAVTLELTGRLRNGQRAQPRSAAPADDTTAGSAQ